MSKDSSARYLEKQRKIKKKLVKGIKIFLKKKSTKSKNKVTNNIKISLSVKNKG